MKSASKLFYGILSIFMFTIVLGTAGVAAPVAIGVGVIGSAATSAFSQTQYQVAPAIVLLDMWDRELIKQFRHKGEWLSVIPRKDKYVKFNAINLVELGADPDVLINNVTYPIPIQQIDDDTIVVTLDKFQTKATPVTDDELVGIPYDKEGSLLERHRLTLEDMSRLRSLHGLAPQSDTAQTPIVETTGGDNGDGFKMCTNKDVIKLAKRFKDAKIPKVKGQWHLILSPQHVADLLETDSTLAERMHDHEDGSIVRNYYGFTIWEDVWSPSYDASSTLKAWGAAAAGTDRISSIAFVRSRSWQARGGAKNYYSPASKDPQNQRSLFNQRVYHKCGKKTNLGFGAIISVPVT